MAIGTGTVKLSQIITEFGGAANTPYNLRSYFKCGNFIGWDGGVANHENNANVPFTGTASLKISDFRSYGNYVVDKDFESDTYTGQLNTYFDYSIPYLEAKSGLYTSDTSIMLFLTFSGYPAGTIGTINTIGKSTYDASPGFTEVATVDSIFDYGIVSGVPDSAALVLNGDERSTGWGNPWISASVTIGATTTTLNRADTVVPNGTYDAVYNKTYWLFNNIFGFVNGDYNVFNFKMGLRTI
jgi:hypothetical protein